jgi:hypothetical protein
MVDPDRKSKEKRSLLSPMSVESVKVAPKGFLPGTKARPRHAFVLALHLSGKKTSEIAEITGYNLQYIYRILNQDEEILALRQQHLSILDKEFEAMWAKVMKTVEDAIDDGDVDVRLRAVDIWMKAMKRYKTDTQIAGTVNLTAEDIVVQILQGNVPQLQIGAKT